MKRSCCGKTFLSGVMWLSLSAMLVKVLGLLTKIPMLHLLGAEGMGYYNTAYEVYAFLFVLSSAGLPVALSILISEREGAARQILRVALRLFLLLGGVGALLLWLLAEPLSAAMGNSGAAGSMRAIAPAVLLVCLSSALRGYEQGRQNMVPTALSQVLEAVGKLVFGLLFAAAAVRHGATYSRLAAAGAMGVSAGTALSLFYLLLHVGRVRARESGKARGCSMEPLEEKHAAHGIVGRLVTLAVPITAGSCIITLTRLLDMVLILRRLQACGLREETVNIMYGAYSTLAVPLYSLIPALISSIALPLVPGIARARECGDIQGERELVCTAFRLTVMCALPASLGLSAFARPILTLLFGAGEGAVALAAPQLTILGASVLGACLMTVTAAMLQAYHRPHLSLYSMMIGSAVKLLSAYLLLGRADVGMRGAPISTFLCNLTVVLLDLAFLAPFLPRERQLLNFCRRAFFSAVFAVGSVFALWRVAERGEEMPRAAILGAILLCVMLYLLLILRMGALRREDVEHLPHGADVWVVMERLHLIKSE